MTVLREMQTRDKEYFAQFKGLTDTQFHAALAKDARVNPGANVGDDYEKNWAIEFGMIGKCMQMGAITEAG